MKLEQLIQKVELRLFQLGATLLEPGDKPTRADELKHVRAELQARQEELKSAEAQRDELRRRIDEKKIAAAVLAGQVETSFRHGKSAQAMRQAIELENLRRCLNADESELPRLEQTIWSMDFQVRQLRRSLDRLREQRKGR
jgi:chromosome segregation ATPase